MAKPGWARGRHRRVTRLKLARSVRRWYRRYVRTFGHVALALLATVAASCVDAPAAAITAGRKLGLGTLEAPRPLAALGALRVDLPAPEAAAPPVRESAAAPIPPEPEVQAGDDDVGFEPPRAAAEEEAEDARAAATEDEEPAADNPVIASTARETWVFAEPSRRRDGNAMLPSRFATPPARKRTLSAFGPAANAPAANGAK